MTTKFLYATVIAATTAALILGAEIDIVTGKDVTSALLALLGTFLGALFAFRLNEHKEAAKLSNEQKAALNQALFVLVRQFNAMRIYSNYLAPFKNPVERAINLPASKPPTYSDLTVKFQDLGFLLEGEHANVLMRLMIEQERFHQSLEGIRIRNEFHITELQPAIERLALNKATVTEAQLRTALGERLFSTAINYGETVNDNVKESVQSLATMHEELFKAAKILFPDDKFVKFVANT